MKKINEQTKQSILALTVSGIFIVMAWFVFSHASSVIEILNKLLKALTPFIFGFAITFIVSPLMWRIENGFLKNVKWDKKTRRNVSVMLSMIVFLLVIASFFVVLIPQLSSSIATLSKNMDGYLQSVQDFFGRLYDDTEIAGLADALYERFRSAVDQFVTGTAGFVASIVSYSVTILRGIFDFLIGLIIAIYLLTDHEKFHRQTKRVVYALIPWKQAEQLAELSHLSSKMFYNFIFGKALDSLIIGVICWLVTMIMRTPYAMLISFIIGITNMIPVFGPFIGAVPCIFILLIIRPFAALEFAIFIVILQQVDGNIIGPRILGDSMGLPPIWIMFAILIGGALFGVLGMFLGVPVFSVIYILTTKVIRGRLKEKDIRIE